MERRALTLSTRTRVAVSPVTREHTARQARCRRFSAIDYIPVKFVLVFVLVVVSSSLYVSHIFVTRVLSSLVFQSCPSLEFVSPLQVTHLPPVWDLLLPLA